MREMRPETVKEWGVGIQGMDRVWTVEVKARMLA